MKTYYTNSQIFAVTGRFSVAQRRAAWNLRRHPRKFVRKGGAQWKLVSRKSLQEASIPELRELEAEARRGFTDVASLMWSVAQELRARGLKPDDASHTG